MKRFSYVHLRVAPHWDERHFVEVKWATEMATCQHIWGGIRLRMRLIVISVCGSSWSHRLGGKLLDTPTITLRKWALRLCMATSAAFRWWHPSGTNSMSNLCVSRMWYFMFSETLLSSTCFFETMPTCYSRWRSASYARIISASLQLFMGLTRMALLLISTITMMYLLPCYTHIGNWLVWLENMVSCTLYILVYTSPTFFPWIWEVLHVLIGRGFSLVERMFFLVWFKYPLAVSVALG